MSLGGLSINFNNPKRSKQPYCSDSKIFLRVNVIVTQFVLSAYKQTHWFDDINFPIRSDFFELKEWKLTEGSSSCTLQLTESQQTHLQLSGFITLSEDIKERIFYFQAFNNLYYSSNGVNIKLEHILCACRIAHHIKLYARDKLGQHTTIEECEKFLKTWLNKYTSLTTTKGSKFKYPLKKYVVKLNQTPGKVGAYFCTMNLEPHMRLEYMNSSITLHSELYST